MAMDMLRSKKVILLCILVLLPLHSAKAGSFSRMLQAMGITIAPSGVKSSGSIFQGNLWLSKIDGAGAHEPKPLTRDGTYHSPLWIPGSNQILAVKGNNLVQLEIDGSQEKMLFPLSETTTLHGFDQRDAKSVLILQEKHDDIVPAVLSLTNGQITLLPYDKKNSEDRIAVDRLRGDNRNYDNIEIVVDRQSIFDATGTIEKINKIRIKANQRIAVIPCPGDCAQPALSEDGRKLVFVGP